MKNMMINDIVFAAQNIDGTFLVLARGLKRLKPLYENKKKITVKTDSINISGIIEEIRQFSQMSGFYKDQIEFTIETKEKIKVRIIVDI